MSVCTKCGLPKELCTCSQLVMEEQLVKVYLTKRRYGKPVTIIKGINFDELGMPAVKDLVKMLKKSLACGGTIDKADNLIELQGSHEEKVKKILADKGFNIEGYQVKMNEEQSN